MATIGDRATIDLIVQGTGIYPGDEDNFLGPVVRIVEYTNIADQRVWGIVYLYEVYQGLWDKYVITSEYLRDPKEHWRHPDMIEKTTQ